MTDVKTPLAEDFDAAGQDLRARWLALVEKTLKGADFDQTLVRRTADGVAVQPLYVAGDAPAVTRDLRLRDAARPWDLRMAVAHPDPMRANVEALKDLQNGAASILVAVDPRGAAGVAAGSAQGLRQVLDGVLLDLAPVALDAGFLGPQAAGWLDEAAKSAPHAPLAFHMDPLGAFMQAGASPGPIQAHVDLAAKTGARLAATYSRASLMLATGRAAHEAGASEADELALMAACALAYAKALVEAGLSMDQAFGRIVLGVGVDGEYFTGVAKLRAAKAVWARLCQVCGALQPARIEARSSHRMLTAADPWTNLLRLTAAGFAAATGGADTIVLGCFTDALGLPTEFARRQARNTQLVLMEESHIGRVADPAGGAWYLDSLTDQLARAAWSRLQQIEAAGGVVAALETGLIAGWVRTAREAQQAAFADKSRKILGVTAFPNPDEKPVETAAADRAAFACAAPDPRLPGQDSACPALTPIRFSAAFEAA